MEPSPPPIETPPAPDWPPSWFAPQSPPLVIDFGSHRGKFLVAMAAGNPGSNFLGIEWQKERVTRTLQKIQRRALPNAHVVRAEGMHAARCLPAAAASSIHILFPDPWPKRRHAARRLVNAAFLTDCTRALREGGLLRILTDEEGYAAQILRTLKGFPMLKEIPEPPFPPTGFEEKFLASGKPIFRFTRARQV